MLNCGGCQSKGHDSGREINTSASVAGKFAAMWPKQQVGAAVKWRGALISTARIARRPGFPIHPQPCVVLFNHPAYLVFFQTANQISNLALALNV